jgi:hypothetical protein
MGITPGKTRPCGTLYARDAARLRGASSGGGSFALKLRAARRRDAGVWHRVSRHIVYIVFGRRFVAGARPFKFLHGRIEEISAGRRVELGVYFLWVGKGCGCGKGLVWDGKRADKNTSCLGNRNEFLGLLKAGSGKEKRRAALAALGAEMGGSKAGRQAGFGTEEGKGN